MNFESIFNTYKVATLFGRYITLDTIEPLLQKWNTDHQLQVIGESVLGKPIYSYTIGTGKIKILMWSQMHGNEGTTTKALFDFLNLLHSGSELSRNLLSQFTFYCLPMVNPDGAKLYTRENANNIDLNRDAFDLSQPESKVLRATFDTFKPDYCYNLHDQRTIYGAGKTGNPATISFLAPAFNVDRHIHHARAKAIDIIAAMNETLQKYIPNQVGRFDDAFNINCVGDTFQSLNVPTILFEAGHFFEDYDREISRKYILIALLSGFEFLNENVIVSNGMRDYLNIPQNNICFYDFVYKNVKINYDNNKRITNFAAQFTEELIDDKIQFNAYIAEIGDLKDIFGHVELNAKEEEYKDDYSNNPEINRKAEFYLGDKVKIVNGIIKN
jgi:hypothetical protein